MNADTDVLVVGAGAGGLGAGFHVRVPDPLILDRIGGKDIDVTGGGWGFLLSRLTRQGARVLAGRASPSPTCGTSATG